MLGNNNNMNKTSMFWLFIYSRYYSKHFTYFNAHNYISFTDAKTDEVSNPFKDIYTLIHQRKYYTENDKARIKS